MKKGLIFDFDGTMVDSERVVFEALKAYLWQHHQFEYSFDHYKERVGKSEDSFEEDINALVGEPVDVNAVEKWIGKTQIEVYETMALRPGIEEVLDLAAAKNRQRGIVSNSVRKELDYYLLKHPAINDHFETIVTVEQVQPKPSPEGYRKCLQTLNLDASEAIAFEDSPTGAQAAVTAGLTTIVYPNDFTQQATFPEQAHIVKNGEELLALVEQLLAE